MLLGFAPRKKRLVVYIMPGFELWPQLMDELGKYKTGRSCLYIRALADVDLGVLDQLVCQSVAVMRGRYDCQ